MKWRVTGKINDKRHPLYHKATIVGIIIANTPFEARDKFKEKFKHTGYRFYSNGFIVKREA